MTSTALSYFATPVEAYIELGKIIRNLSNHDHSTTEQLRDGRTADVYAVLYYGETLYLKLVLDEANQEVLVVSCHPPTRPLWTKKGTLR